MIMILSLVLFGSRVSSRIYIHLHTVQRETLHISSFIKTSNPPKIHQSQSSITKQAFELYILTLWLWHHAMMNACSTRPPEGREPRREIIGSNKYLDRVCDYWVCIYVFGLATFRGMCMWEFCMGGKVPRWMHFVVCSFFLIYIGRSVGRER